MKEPITREKTMTASPSRCPARHPSLTCCCCPCEMPCVGISSLALYLWFPSPTLRRSICALIGFTTSLLLLWSACAFFTSAPYDCFKIDANSTRQPTPPLPLELRSFILVLKSLSDERQHALSPSPVLPFFGTNLLTFFPCPAVLT